ncbi:hypothetical protein RCZ02_18320 [Capnocytophaga felis]|uniref:DUF6261 family protein n=1 Tax=Capnocytophaga felis TaxID=2267611 RepID=UPI0012C7D225|nr:DUF6261 family protein [Capnocytophaga felis]GET49001.1 hypothetical protein RCZ02_18320 [Capnocytophaga felis]
MYTIVKVKTISLNSLNNNEYSQFMKSTENLVEVATNEKLAIKEDIFNSFKEHIKLLIDATNKSKSRHETKKLNELNKRRNELVIYLLSVFRVESKSTIQNKKEAASIIYSQMKSYLGISKQPNRQKTNIIDSMIHDLSKIDNTKHLKILGVNDVITELTEVNKQYSKLTEERAENQVKTILPNVKVLRKDIDVEYDLITNWAYASSLISPSDEATNFIKMINKLIDDTVSLRKQRIGMLKKIKPEEKTK